MVIVTVMPRIRVKIRITVPSHCSVKIQAFAAFLNGEINCVCAYFPGYFFRLQMSIFTLSLSEKISCESAHYSKTRAELRTVSSLFDCQLGYRK